MSKEKNCGDCIHRELCNVHGYIDADECACFQNKDDFVEVKHGYWIDKPTGRYLHQGTWCSVCGNKSGIGGIESNRHKPYCPNCGAKMDGKDGAE